MSSSFTYYSVQIIWYICLTAIGMTRCGIRTVHIYTQYNTQNTEKFTVLCRNFPILVTVRLLVHTFLFRLSVYKIDKICSFISALLHAQNHGADEERVHAMSKSPQHVELLSCCKYVVCYNAVTQRQLLWHVSIACSRNIVVQAKTTSLSGKMIEIARIEVLTAVLLRLRVFWAVGW